MKEIERRIIDGCIEVVLARFNHFCGIYGASSADRWRTRSPAFRFSLGKAHLRMKISS